MTNHAPIGLVILATLLNTCVAQAVDGRRSADSLARERRATALIANTKSPAYSQGGDPKPHLAAAVRTELYSNGTVAVGADSAFRLLMDTAQWDAAFAILTEERANLSASTLTEMCLSAMQMPIDSSRLVNLRLPTSPEFSNPIQAKIWSGFQAKRASLLSALDLRGQPVPSSTGETVLQAPEAARKDCDLVVHGFLNCSAFNIGKILEAVADMAATDLRPSTRIQWHLVSSGSVLHRTKGLVAEGTWAVVPATSPANEEAMALQLVQAYGIQSEVLLSRGDEATARWKVESLPTFVIEGGGRELDRFLGWDRATRIKLRSLMRHDMNQNQEELAESLRIKIRSAESKAGK